MTEDKKKEEQERRDVMEELSAEEAARAEGGLCEACGCFTVQPRCGCGWRLCKEHDEPGAHNRSCTHSPGD